MKKEDDYVYKKMYLTLFNSVSDALRELEAFDAVACRRILMDAQKKCEEIYISRKGPKK